jgi:hypothetical protein
MSVDLLQLIGTLHEGSLRVTEPDTALSLELSSMFV